MMNLIGDPLLRIHHPVEIQLQDLAQAKPGERIKICGTSALAGQLQVELAYRRDQSVPNLVQLDAFSADADNRKRAQATYLSANSRVLSQAEAVVSEGNFEVPLDVPADLPRGKYAVRLFLSGQKTWATGYQTIAIRP